MGALGLVIAFWLLNNMVFMQNGGASKLYVKTDPKGGFISILAKVTDEMFIARTAALIN